MPRAKTVWALDSGGFTELNLYGEWRVTAKEYVGEVRQYAAEVGKLAWAAPQDWMCEPVVREKTGRTVLDHQERTVASFLELRALAPEVWWLPVIQGFECREYERCLELYDRAGVDLRAESLIGLGTVCRRQGTTEGHEIVSRLHAHGLKLHAFGAKTTGLKSFGHLLESSDSMAWSFHARRAKVKLPGCNHATCANCLRYALEWREDLLRR